MSFLLNSRRLATSVSFAALTIGLAFGQQLTQKASAQISTPVGHATLVGSGSTSFLVFVSNWSSISYTANGSGRGIADFVAGITDFVSTDLILPNVPGQVVINTINIPVAIIYNLPGFTASLSTSDLCGIIAGNITDFSQLSVPGAPQPISFYYRSDSSGTTSILNTFTTANCGFSVPPFPVGTGVAGRDGMISAVQGTVGAIGYVDTPAAQDTVRPIGFVPLAIQGTVGPIGYVDPPAATLADVQIATLDTTISGLNYVVFRGSYPAPMAADARTLCQYITDDSPSGGRTHALALGYTAGTSTSSDCSAIQDAPSPDPAPSPDAP